MGNITNKPKAPAPQVVYVPQVGYEPAPTNNNNSGSDSSPTPEQQREKSLLARNRSRLGTVLTGFRGLLAPLANENSGQRKTLLGE